MLAETYRRALACEKAGDLDAAAAAYDELLRLDPSDRAGVAVRLASIGRGATPDKAPPAYVAKLFDQHAATFDDILVEGLGYAVPMMARELLQRTCPGPFARMLDLGCGTGLAGSALRDMAGHVTGVDLSEGMLEIADDRGVYDDLYVGDVAGFLAADDPDRWDLIVATDVLPYLGDLDPLFSGVARCLEQEGVFVFSSESLPEEVMQSRPYMVGAKPRFAHAEAHVRDRLGEAGMTCVAAEPITVRHEEGAPVPGQLYLGQLYPGQPDRGATR